MRFSAALKIALALGAMGFAGSWPARPSLAGQPLPDRAVARVGGAAIRHQNAHGGVALIDAGKTVVTFPNRSGDQYRVRFWDAETGRPLERKLKGVDALRKIIPGPRGKILLGYTALNHLVRIDLGKGEVTLKLKLPKIGRGHGLAVSHDGALIVCSGHSNTALIDGRSGKVIRHLDIPGSGVSLTPDAKRLAISPGQWGREKYGGRVLLVDVDTGKVSARTSDKFGRHFNEVCFSGDGKYFVGLAYGRDPTLNVFDAATAKHVRKLEAGERLSGMAVRGNTLAVAARHVEVWDIATGRRLHDIPVPYVRSGSLAFSVDGKRLAIKDHNGIVDVLDVSTGQSILPPGAATRSMYCAVAEPAEGGAIWTSDLAGRVQRWTPDPSGYRLDRTVHVSDAVARLQLAEGGRALLIIDNERTTWLDTAKGDQPRRIDITALRPATFRCIDAVDGGRRLMAIDQTGTVRRMLLPSGPTEVVLASAVNGAALSDESPESITVARFSPRGQWAWVQQLAGPVLVHLRTGGKTLVKADRRADGVAFGPRGDCIATASSRRLEVWEVDSARAIMSIQNKTSLLDAATFLADGRLLAVGNVVGGIHVYDVVSGSEVTYLQGHSDHAKPAPALARQRRGGGGCRIQSLRYVPEREWLISAADDGSAMIWNVADLQPGELKLDEEPLEDLWKRLGAEEAKEAWPALLELAGREQVADFLSQRLESESAVDPDEVDRLVAQLDAKRFRERRDAYEQLAALGPRASQALRKSLRSRSISPESQRRVEALLDSWSQASGGPGLVHRRAVRVLERVASRRAVEVLKRLAKGDKQGMLTIAADEALRRLDATASPEASGD